ncbi:RNA-dependent RNA polymerase [Aspergillus niger victorivirus 1]|nr:RNA-dependent RNA polymerase [Aspergillus niger victorivirus 1]
MSVSRVAERAKELGPLGSYLAQFVDLDWATKVVSLPFEEQISQVYSPTYNGLRVLPLQRAASAFLVPDFPVQVALPERTLLHLVLQTLDLAPVPKMTSTTTGWGKKIGNTLSMFPLKNNPAASNRVNVFLSEILSDLSAFDPQRYLQAVLALYPYRTVMFNDQASGVILYGTGLSFYGMSDAYRVAAALVMDPDYAKSLTVFVKAIGANGSRLGSMLVEANTLRGRDVGGIDLVEEARYRTTSAVYDKIATFDESELRAACRRLLMEEISLDEDKGYLIQYPTLSEHWDRRWGWAVNGAHSGHVSKLYARAPRPPGMLREHRRAWLESVEDDPRPSWDGHTFVSVSPKLESGKTRAIFACDTVNYLAFEHLLAPVEKRWRNKRVILDPGKGGHTGMVFATAAARGRSGVSMMLDYDDFNSQHSTRSMQILVEELIELTGYDSQFGRTLVSSFDKCDIYVGDKYIGRSLGTLMSGHRGTTFINTCLNKVYLDLVLGRDTVDAANSLHVGDDVYFGVHTYRRAGEVSRTLKTSQLRMNPIKQSVGHLSTEFLRNCSSGRATRAYLARGVAGVIAGNWASDIKLSPSEAITSMIAAGRTLANRSGADDLPLLLFSSLQRITRLPKEDHKKLRELLTGTTALDNGPQFKAGGYYRSCKLLTVVEQTDNFGYAPLPRAATSAFLTRAASTLESQVLCEAGVSVVDMMEEASFRKSLPARYQNYETVRLGNAALSSVIGTASVADLINERAPRGVLQSYPLLTLARNRLPEALVRWAVKQAGGDPLATDLELEAWGEYKHGCIIATPMSYADAAMFGHRTNCSVLVSPVNIYV